MFRVDSANNVFMTRGDDVSLTITIKNPNGSTYTMAAQDALTLTARASYGSSSAAFTAVSTGTNTITIPANSTRNVACGKYVYDIELHKASGSTKHTIIGQDGLNSPSWTLLEDVTR